MRYHVTAMPFFMVRNSNRFGTDLEEEALRVVSEPPEPPHRVSHCLMEIVLHTTRRIGGNRRFRHQHTVIIGDHC